MSRPESEDIFAKKPGFFSWLRDRAYDFVYYEIGTGLDFIGDMFRGPSGYSQSLHKQSDKAQAKHKPEMPLTRDEKAVFVDMLKRTEGEPQVMYWKRKKALLNNPDPKGLVAQQIALQAEMSKRRGGDIQVEAARSSNPLNRSVRQKHTQKRSQR